VDQINGQNAATDATTGQNDAARDAEIAANERNRDTLTDILRSGEKGKDYAANRQAVATLAAVMSILTAKWKSSEREPAELVAQFLRMDRDTIIRELVDPACDFMSDLQFALTTEHQSKLKGGHQPKSLVRRFVVAKVAPSSKTGELSELFSQIAAAL
jgi:hypothetical protein